MLLFLLTEIGSLFDEEIIMEKPSEGNPGMFFRRLDENNFYVSSVFSELSLDYGGGYLYCIDGDGETVYRMTNPKVTYKVDNTLKLEASYELEMPVWFAGQIISWFTVPVTVSSSLTLK